MDFPMRLMPASSEPQSRAVPCRAGGVASKVLTPGGAPCSCSYWSSPIGLLMIWTIVYDVKHRRAPVTGNSPRAFAKKTRIDGEGNSSEWGAGGEAESDRRPSAYAQGTCRRLRRYVIMCA